MRLRKDRGYTLIELMIVVVIVGLIASLISPHYDLVLVKAFQARARGNLAAARAAINIYYTEQEGDWPLIGYPPGNTHSTTHGLSLTGTLVPKYSSGILTPKLKDRNPAFNGLTASYDVQAAYLMNLNPPQDVFIVLGEPDYTPLLNSPFAYDNTRGYFYISNGNYDSQGEYFYTW